MEPVVVGIVGSGFAAALHADAWRRVSGVPVELRAVASATPARAHAFAERWGVPVVHPTPDALLADPAVTVVDVCAPDAFHAPLALAALAAGKHVVVEKPLTGWFGERRDAEPRSMWRDAVATADAVVAAAEAAGRHCGYAENWLYAPPFEKARRLLAASGATVLRIQGEESHSGTHSAANHRWVTAGGGAMLGKGCHPLAAALHLKAEAGVAPESVVAHTASLTRVDRFVGEDRKWIRTGYVDVEDYGTMLVTFTDGTVAEITATDTTLGGVRNRMTVFASTCVLEVNMNPNTAVRAYTPSPDTFADEYIVEKTETKAGWSYPSADEEWMQGYPQEAQDFAEAVAHGRPPRADARLGRAVVDVTYAAYVSAAEGRRVALAERG